MRRFLEQYLAWLEVWRCRRRIERALALQLCGEVRPDGLQLAQARHRLEIQWRARDIHPWDRHLPAERAAPLFVEQCLADTEQAVLRLFAKLPQIDLIDLAVLDLQSDEVIIAGTVERAALGRDHQPSSVRMRLRQLGLQYHLSGSHFEPLDENCVQETLRTAHAL